MGRGATTTVHVLAMMVGSNVCRIRLKDGTTHGATIGEGRRSLETALRRRTPVRVRLQRKGTQWVVTGLRAA